MTTAKPASIEWGEDDRLDVVTFDLSRERFALEATLVNEIIDPLPETIVPGAPALLRGVINYRGRIVPVADLHVAFGLPPRVASRDSRIIVVAIELEKACEEDDANGFDEGPVLLGLHADQVHQVTSVERSGFGAAPAIGLRWPPALVRGLVRHEGALIALPCLRSILRLPQAIDGECRRPAHS